MNASSVSVSTFPLLLTTFFSVKPEEVGLSLRSSSVFFNCQELSLTLQLPMSKTSQDIVYRECPQTLGDVKAFSGILCNLSKTVQEIGMLQQMYHTCVSLPKAVSRFLKQRKELYIKFLYRKMFILDQDSKWMNIQSEFLSFPFIRCYQLAKFWPSHNKYRLNFHCDLCRDALWRKACCGYKLF